MGMLRVAAVVFLVLATVAVWANRPPLTVAGTASRVVVDKSERALWLMDGDAVLARYPVSLGADGDGGHKQREGDERTPEGRYALDWRNAESAYHRSIRVSYPDDADAARARIQGDDPGGMIMIHGARNGLGWLGRLHRALDWTDGCIAVTNAEMDQIWATVPDGTPIDIRP